MRCECGHLQGDHQSSRARGPHPAQFGICYLCPCDEFKPAPEDERR
jgi:hypothetical protein